MRTLFPAKNVIPAPLYRKKVVVGPMTSCDLHGSCSTSVRPLRKYAPILSSLPGGMPNITAGLGSEFLIDYNVFMKSTISVLLNRTIKYHWKLPHLYFWSLCFLVNNRLSELFMLSTIRTLKKTDQCYVYQNTENDNFLEQWFSTGQASGPTFSFVNRSRPDILNHSHLFNKKSCSNIYAFQHTLLIKVK